MTNELTIRGGQRPSDKSEYRWVYVYEAHVIGIATPDNRSPEDAWKVVVLPDWMSLAFLKRLPGEADGWPDLIHYVMLYVPESQLIMGEVVKSLEVIQDEAGHWRDNPADRFLRYLPPTTEDLMMNTRILLDGVLIWGREDYPGERQIVVPRVKIPKKLAKSIPALKDGVE